MGVLSGIGHALGSALKVASPFATLIPGVGPGIAAAGEGLGQLMAPGGNLKQAIIGGGTSYLGGRLASGLGYGGGAGGAAPGGIPSADTLTGLNNAAASAVDGAMGAGAAGAAGTAATQATQPGGLGGLLQRGLGYLGKNPGVLQAGLGLVGGAMEGKAQGQLLDKQLAAQHQQLQLAQTPIANGLYNQMQANPMRDRALYALTQRAGMAPQSFQPNDLFNGGHIGGQGQMGGTLQPMQQAMANYTPGAGGTSTAMQKALLSRFGGLPTS